MLNNFKSLHNNKKGSSQDSKSTEVKKWVAKQQLKVSRAIYDAMRGKWWKFCCCHSQKYSYTDAVGAHMYVLLWVKNLPANAGDTRDMGWVPESRRSPGRGNGNPLQCSSLEIPWTEEPGRLQSIESQRVRHNWACMHTQ